MPEVLLSGKSSFKIEVPYKLFETGEKGAKPLIVYLHGYKQNIDSFQKLVKDMMKLEAYHLFIQAPYPIYDESRSKKVKDWGRYWYLYDGEQEQFVRSMELSSEFIQEIMDSLIPNLTISRICMFGYSMGGYLAGYFMFSRWKHVNESIIIGARIKTEVFEGKLEQAKHLNILALHGDKDVSVFPEPQKKEVEKLESLGFNASFVTVNTEHRLADQHIKEAKSWLRKLDY